MISVKLLNHGIEYVCILECVCVCVLHLFTNAQGSGWEPGGLAAVPSLALGNSPPPAEIQTLPGDSAGGITSKVAYSSTIAY